MFWKRSNGRGGFWGLLAGSLSGAFLFLLYETHVVHFGSALSATFAQAGLAFVVDLVVTVVLSLTTAAPARERLAGIVYGVAGPDGVVPTVRQPREPIWWRRPMLLGGVVLAATPLGSVGDASARLRAALAETPVVAAEDTRRLRRLAADLDVTIGGRVHVRPPWCDPPPAPTGPDADALLDIVIDPNQAFGTGAHATTQLCLEALLALDRPSPPGALVDLGCGSGVLAIAAARLGWDPVSGVDHEAAAVEAARENALANGVALDVRHGDLLHDGRPVPSAPTVVAALSVVERALFASWSITVDRSANEVVTTNVFTYFDTLAALS